ncbi:hypothetical protein B0H14DRAFT_2559647 [Mycena olivaceomarginata]|nr:hypothetical protein B0H14DRAFT_2559647 [Mycena olivaceomarginata]
MAEEGRPRPILALHRIILWALADWDGLSYRMHQKHQDTGHHSVGCGPWIILQLWHPWARPRVDKKKLFPKQQDSAEWRQGILKYCWGYIPRGGRLSIEYCSTGSPGIGRVGSGQWEVLWGLRGSTMFLESADRAQNILLRQPWAWPSVKENYVPYIAGLSRGVQKIGKYYSGYMDSAEGFKKLGNIIRAANLESAKSVWDIGKYCCSYVPRVGRLVQYCAALLPSYSTRHSTGVFGRTVHEPMTDLIALMGRLVAPDGKILVPGVDDTVSVADAEERTIDEKLDYSIVLMGRMRLISLSLHSIEGAFAGPGPKTVIPARVGQV